MSDGKHCCLQIIYCVRRHGIQCIWPHQFYFVSFWLDELTMTFNFSPPLSVSIGLANLKLNIIVNLIILTYGNKQNKANVD